MDRFPVGQGKDFEIHVVRSSQEVGVFGSNGWFSKHSLGTDVSVPDSVANRLKGISVNEMRPAGRLAVYVRLMKLLDEHATAELARARLTYPEVGRTAGRLPAGYRHIRHHVRVPDEIGFDQARRELFKWTVHERAGLCVLASADRVTESTVVVLALGLGRVSIRAPLRVVYAVDEPDRCGFAYGTLSGHPECGEEAFVLERDGEGVVTFSITAFSRPASALAKILAPVASRVQDIVTERYLRAYQRR